jgi:hypothetical protein
MILGLIDARRLRVDAEQGLVFALRSNTPDKPAGAETAKGYLRVCLTVNGRQQHFMAHRIVWVSVNGPLPDGLEIDHRNRDKKDNRISNLEAVPGAVNMDRARRAGAFRHVGRRDGVRDSKGRFGKKAAGRLLDGRTWDEVPG